MKTQLAFLKIIINRELSLRISGYLLVVISLFLMPEVTLLTMAFLESLSGQSLRKF